MTAAISYWRLSVATVGVGLVMSVAVLTCNGWLGLMCHWVVLSGAASLLTKGDLPGRRQAAQDTAGALPGNSGDCATASE